MHFDLGPFMRCLYPIVASAPAPIKLNSLQSKRGQLKGRSLHTLRTAKTGERSMWTGRSLPGAAAGHVLQEDSRTAPPDTWQNEAQAQHELLLDGELLGHMHCTRQGHQKGQQTRVATSFDDIARSELVTCYGRRAPNMIESGRALILCMCAK